MDDGYWENDSSTVFLCTDNFTLDEISLLIKILTKNFNLTTTTKKRIKFNKEVCWRIRFSGKKENINLLKSLVLPYFIPSMVYKLGLK